MQELCELKSTQTLFTTLAKLNKYFTKYFYLLPLTPWEPDNIFYYLCYYRQEN